MNKITLLFAISFISFSCTDPKQAIPKPTEEGRNVLAYIISDNNLYNFAVGDVNEMEEAWRNDFNGKLFVFLNKKGGESVLLEISHDDNPSEITSKVIKTYPKTQDPCDPTFFRSIIDQTYALYPAKNRGLILWSHGSGWLPENSRYPYNSPEKLSKLDHYYYPNDHSGIQYSFGATDTFRKEMEVYDIAASLEGLNFDFITFDACYMACIEVYYQLRNVSDYIMASSAETLADGSPYDQITELMFEPTVNVPEMALRSFNYYDKQSGARKSSTYSVIQTNKLEDLALATKRVITPKTLQSNGVQEFGRSPFNSVLFDLEDFVVKNWTNSPNLSSFKRALNGAVIYKASTAQLFNQITVNTHCGMTSYIPKAIQPNTLKVYRERYSWSKDSGLGDLF